MTKAEKLLETSINEFVIHGIPASIVKKVWKARKGEEGRIIFILKSGETLSRRDCFLLYKEQNVVEISTIKINNIPLLTIIYQAGRKKEK